MLIKLFMFGRSKSQPKLRSRITSLVAFLFVIYAVADVSVLQAYCGNEALGIPPAHHIIENVNSVFSVEQEDYIISADRQQRQSDDEHEYDHPHECFCWHQTVVTSYCLIQRKVTVNSISQLPAFRASRHQNSDLDLNLRPPQSS